MSASLRIGCEVSGSRVLVSLSGPSWRGLSFAQVEGILKAEGCKGDVGL